MPNELKPCPFCKGRAEIIKCGLFGNDAGYYPKCKKCGCELKVYVTKQGAEKAWNRRATDGE